MPSAFPTSVDPSVPVAAARAAEEPFSTGRGADWRELGVVFAVLALVHVWLWSRSLPLAYQDLSFYFEPAILLAKHGWLAGPASHYHDFTYVRGMYFYPPGFPLVLASWIRAFGFEAGSLLAYTHVVHLGYLFGLWTLLRVRLRCTRLAAALAIVSAFPMFNHGRADGTALLLGVLAWLVLPTGMAVGRLVAAGVLLGGAVLVSPPFGISSAAAVGVFYLATADGPVRRRAGGFALLTSAAVIAFAGTWALVLTWQDAWGYGMEQFAVNSRVRAAELNHFPALSPYLIAFSAIPLGLLTLVPVLFALLPMQWRSHPRLRITALAYLGGFMAWFVLSKAPLLTGGHHSYLGRPVFHASLASARGWLGRMGLLVMLAFAAVHWYHQKETVLALAQGFSGFGKEVERIDLPEGAIVALDSDAFPFFYRDGRSVTYELMDFDYWRRTRAETSPETLAALGVGGCESPIIPDVVVVSSRTLMIFGPPDEALFVAADGVEPQVELATILGRPVRFPRDPAKLHLYHRRSEAVAPAGVPRAGCDLLPATPNRRAGRVSAAGDSERSSS